MIPQRAQELPVVGCPDTSNPCGGRASESWVCVARSISVYREEDVVTEFDGHTLEGAYIRKELPDKLLNIKLFDGGSLIEYRPRDPDNYWTGTWSVDENDNLILQIGPYRSTYSPRKSTSKAYEGNEHGKPVKIWIWNEVDENKHRLNKSYILDCDWCGFVIGSNDNCYHCAFCDLYYCYDCMIQYSPGRYCRRCGIHYLHYL